MEKKNRIMRDQWEIYGKESVLRKKFLFSILHVMCT